MWKKIKPRLSKLVLWSVKNHWLILVILAFFQYFSSPLRRWHILGGKLFLAMAIILTLEKLYLYLIKKGKI